jgi:iduronate 2-sulfatase
MNHHETRPENGAPTQPVWGICTAICLLTQAANFCAAADKPNIVVILTDDQGYADISLNPHHPQEVSTPHMDALAEEGVVFTQGYTSGHVCSPTRAGLMLGRYQQRVGVYSAEDGGRGFDPTLPIFPSSLPDDYASTVIGKWHLGLDDDYPELKWHAMSRGFDECYKFMGRGGHSYFDLRSDSECKFAHPIYRNRQRINDEGYLTNRLTEEAVAFIDRNKNRPFFLYLAYNAVHAPAEAPPADIQKYQKQFPGIDNKRTILMAMLKHLDDGVGDVVTKLKREKLFDNTILFFLTDNGGSKAMNANNAPLRGFKGSLYEGGIRTPWIVSWPAKFSGRRKIDTPVISIDILPTALDAVGALPDKNNFDGKSLLPLLTGQSTAHHNTLYWSKGGFGEWAVRRGEWKLRSLKGNIELFQLSADPSEKKNLAAKHPAIVKTLSTAFDAWMEPMAAPITGGSKRWKANAENSTLTEREKQRRQKRADQKKKRKAERKAKRKQPVGERAADPGSRPNVLFIICDDLNTHVSTSGYPHIKTPAFDSLAAAGMTFRRAYCQYPVCGPSRASFLSGLYPQSTGILDNKSDIRQTRPGTVSMPQCFKQAGYWTASVGKVFHNPNTDPGKTAWNEVHRFENDEMPLVTPVRKAFEAEHGSIAKGKARRLWRERYMKIGTQTRGQQQPGYGPSGLRDEQHKDGKNARQIVSWLEDKAYGDKPFFMVCGIQKPHVPFLAPDKYFQMYPKPSLKFALTPSDFWNQAPKTAMVKRFGGFGFELRIENDSLRREYTQAYHACISFIDAQIGLTLDALKRTGRWDDTIVILTSDHGYQLGEHFMWGKVTLFEVCDRIPLVIYAPGQTKPSTSSNGLVELIDLFPTIADLCAVTAPENLQGRSLLPMLQDPTAAGKEVAYTVVSRGNKLGRAIRTDRWRYAKWPDGEELYDLTGDPAEYKNLALSAEHRETIKTMRRQLAKVEAVAVSKQARRSDSNRSAHGD